MLKLGIAGIMANTNTSAPHPKHKIFSYLLHEVQLSRPNQVWSTDITGRTPVQLTTYFW